MYLTCCVDVPRRDVPALHDMIERALDITYRTFTKHIPIREIAELFPCSIYAWGPGHPGELRLKDDWAVRFCRSKYKGINVYYIRHSSIEYIFREQA